MACNTDFLESRENTAGWLIHSNADSNSVSRADAVVTSIPVPGEKLRSVGTRSCWDGLSSLSDVWELGDGGTGKGGRPPLPKPRSMVRVSFRSVCARSCWFRETSVKALLNISDVKSSIRRCTTVGCGGIGGDPGRSLSCLEFGAGNMVIVRRWGRDCDREPPCWISA